MRNTVHYNLVPGTRFDHIAIGVRALGDAAPVLAGVLGGVPDQGRPSWGFRWGTWRYANGGSPQALEPLGPHRLPHPFPPAPAPGGEGPPRPPRRARAAVAHPAEPPPPPGPPPPDPPPGAPGAPPAL